MQITVLRTWILGAGVEVVNPPGKPIWDKWLVLDRVGVNGTEISGAQWR